MEIIKTAGTRCLPQFGLPVVSGPVWSESSGRQTAIPAAADSLDTAAFGGRAVYRRRFRSLINPNGFAMPVTHRMRMSASEP